MKLPFYASILPVSTPDISVCIPSHKKLFWHLCPEARGTRVGACSLVCLSLFIFLCVNVLWATKTQIKPWLKPSYLSPCSFMCLVYLSITLLHAHRQAEQSVDRVKSQTAWAPSAPAVPSWLIYMHTLIRSRCECNITFVFLFPISFNMLANQVMFNILPAHQRLCMKIME